MRRTYKSKKDTGGALNHRDVLLNMDEKSSAFDAFYIQNIKQTKRELSCVGSSNAYGVASKKVRKRKYVKRIVKEVENVQPRESMSTSTYLTPDKSIRVNKILDPFDALLNSSSTGHVTTETNKNDVFDNILPKKNAKVYSRKKLARVKKFSYSNDFSSDSDKENTSNTQSNMTDIRMHNLLVEREPINSPKYFDESINKIVNNLSLINNFKQKTNSSFNTSYKHRNRLTKNCQSPILQKSPLCSTPFKDKYRGKSIYNFSPISTKERESNYVAITEDTNESNNSIVFLCKEKVPELSKKHTSPLIGITIEDNLPERPKKSLIYEDEIDLQNDGYDTEKIEQTELQSSPNNKNYESMSTEQSLFQITEAEPFLGFSDDQVIESIIGQKNDLLKCIQEHNSENEELKSIEIPLEDVNIDNIGNNDSGNYRNFPVVVPNLESENKTDINKSLEIPLEKDVNLSQSDDDMCARDTSRENSSDEDFNSSDKDVNPSDENYSTNNNSDVDESVEKQRVIIISKETTICGSSNSSQVSDKASMYDTCESEQSFEDEKDERKYIKEPKVAIERLDDAAFMKYHEKMQIDKELSHDSISEKEDKSINEPKVTIERLNNSVFIKYYEKMLIDKKDSSCDSILTDESLSESDETTSEGNESQSDVYETQSEVEENFTETDEVNTSSDNNLSASFNNNSQNTISSTINTESDYIEAQANEIIITDSSTTEDVESNDEVSNNEDEKHVSFVTTRRRNVLTNDSMFIFNNSYGSSSTDCDKTVLSNKARLSYFEKSDNEKDISINKSRTFDANDVAPFEDKIQEKTTEIDRNTTNSGLTRHSEVTEIDSSINEVTIIGTEQTDNDKTVNDMSSRQTGNDTELKCCVTTRNNSEVFRDSSISDRFSRIDRTILGFTPSIVLQPGKKWERSLSIYRRMTTMADHFDQSLLEDEAQKKGRKYRQSVISTMEMQDSLHNESINSRRSTFISKPSRPTIRFVKDSNISRISLNTTEVFDDLKGFLTEECDDTVIELSKLSLADSEFEVTVLDNFHESSDRVATARDYVLRRCNQTEPILFDECYPETVLKNCHKIGEGVYGEVFLWRGRDGRARVMKIVPIAGTLKVNGENQKDFHEVISEIVIAMELSALRAPIADIDRYFDEGKDVEALDLHAVENATDVFNEVLAVRCVQGPYPSRLLDLWELYDECKGSENDSPALLPADQQYIVLELANAGQDLESYQFTSAQQAHALFQQIAFGLAVGEEAFQFEHRDLHWGNVLIAPTEQKWATFVLRGRSHRVARCGVAGTVIDYSLSRVSLPLRAERAALYNDLAHDDQLFDAVGDYQFEVYRLMRDKLGNEWKNFEPYTNILWLHYTVDKMITALRYKRTNTKIHKHYIEKLKGIKERILDFKSATEYVLTDIEI